MRISRNVSRVVLSALLIAAVGCTQSVGMRNFMQNSMGFRKPNANGIGDGTDTTDEGWIREAGVEARGDRPLEKDPDVFRDMLMSPKARSIERNLGIE